MDSPLKEAIGVRSEHPVAFWSLLVAMLAPVVGGIAALGLLAKHLFPTPTQLVILAGAGVFVLAIAPLMLVGAFGCWWRTVSCHSRWSNRGSSVPASASSLV